LWIDGCKGKEEKEKEKKRRGASRSLCHVFTVEEYLEDPLKDIKSIQVVRF